MPNLFVIKSADCDPRKCTAERLIKNKILKIVKNVPKNSVILDPKAPMAFSKEDSSSIDEYGLCVIDCSWKKLSSFAKININVKRRCLPFLVPINPINYGKPGKLSTAEALTAALYIIGKKDLAEKIINMFKWGPHFIPHNRKLLERYAKAKNSCEIITAQKEILGENSVKILNS